MSAPDQTRDGIPHGLAELKTPEGTFLIQERRSAPRDPSAPHPDPKPTESAGAAGVSAPMSALGGLIILGVLIGSYTTKYDLAIGHAGGPIAIPAVGFLALQLFLARAAYRLFSDVRQIPGLGAYAEHRLLRYLPAVIPAVILGFAVSRFAGPPMMPAKLSSLPANFLMVADMLGIPEIDSSHWRLKIELILSVSIALAWFTPLRRYLAMIMFLCMAVSVAYLAGEPARQNVLTWHGVLTADGYMPLFAFGIALHHLVLDRKSMVWNAVGALAAVLVFLSNTPVHGLWVLASLAVLTATVTGRLEFMGKVTWLVRLGNLAFPIYVVHFVTGFALIHALELRGVSPLAAMLVASGVAIALGWLVNVCFERPALTYGPALLGAARAACLSKLPEWARPAAVTPANDSRSGLRATA